MGLSQIHWSSKMNLPTLDLIDLLVLVHAHDLKVVFIITCPGTSNPPQAPAPLHSPWVLHGPWQTAGQRSEPWKHLKMNKCRSTTCKLPIVSNCIILVDIRWYQKMFLIGSLKNWAVCFSLENHMIPILPTVDCVELTRHSTPTLVVAEIF